MLIELDAFIKTRYSSRGHGLVRKSYDEIDYRPGESCEVRSVPRFYLRSEGDMHYLVQELLHSCPTNYNANDRCHGSNNRSNSSND